MQSQNNWHERYKAMKKILKITNSDIAKITGNTPDSIKTITQPARIKEDCPGWLKFAIVVFEEMRENQ